MKILLLLAVVVVLTVMCRNITKKVEPPVKLESPKPKQDIVTHKPFDWAAANMYFLLTDRFLKAEGDSIPFIPRHEPVGVMRGFEGGNFAGIRQKINDGYFSNLGVNVLWFSPVFEQIQGGIDEGTGFTYPFHGYWIKDWTSVEPRFGSRRELELLVQEAHGKGIRVIFDIILNHTGPVTDEDPLWEGWARTDPNCTYEDYKTTTACTLVDNLPDIYTESDEEVEIPKHILDKWEEEGRKEQELEELDAFFQKTGLPRAAKNYIIKWLLDLITDFHIDGFRVDTAKHLEEIEWLKLAKLAKELSAEDQRQNPDKYIDKRDFYMVGEVYNYSINGGRDYDFGDRKVDYFDHGFQSLINFEFKRDAAWMDYEQMFEKYDKLLNESDLGIQVLNYATSHDDGDPYDKHREKPYETATRLLLCHGASQIYYGDESARSLLIEGAQGDATLRGNMNWQNMDEELLNHWQKLGQFRNNHLSVGMGSHQMISEKPYVFSRILTKPVKDKVVVALHLEDDRKIEVSSVFPEAHVLLDSYSGHRLAVTDGFVTIPEGTDIALLEQTN